MALLRRAPRSLPLAAQWRVPLIALLAAVCCLPAQAQVLVPSAGVSGGVARSVPSEVYFSSLPTYFNGNYRDSLALFTNESRGGIRNASSQWIDAIPAFTMAGESYYQLGQPKLALEQYDAALKLYVAYSDWMMRIQFRPIAAAINPVRATPWGQSKRGAIVGAFDATYTMSQGQVDQSQVARQGGVIQAAIAFPVHVSEVVRCTCLAIRRRRELMGPVCKHDPLTQSLVDVLSRRPGPPNHWSEAWIQVQLGCAYAAAGNLPQAKTALEQATLVGGQFDHPLTSTALLELAQLALESGDYPAAGRYAEEASYACANFADPGNLEEAFRIGLQAHLLLNQKGPYPPLAHALNWAKNQGSRHLQASLLLLAAENMAVAGETGEAANLLGTARVTMARSDLAGGRVGAQLSYLSAIVAYQGGNVAGGDQAIDAALKFQQSASLWNFQIALADAFYTRGGASDRVAASLYEALLRDPSADDWAGRPLESLSMLSADHEQPLEHWFELLLKSERDRELAVDVADRARRHRFYSTLPLGGRLLALRWILEGPEEILDDEARLQRQNLLGRYPHYAKLAEEAAAIRAKLAAAPVVAAAAPARLAQSELLTALDRVSQAQEVVLREMAVRREAANMVFPPQRAIKDIQSNLDSGQVLLAFFATGRHLHAFLFSNDKFAIWQVRSPAALQKQIATLLRDLGNFEGNHALTKDELTKETWKASSAKTMALLLERSNVDLTGNFEEMIIVPDGPLWYLPFEALLIGPPGKQKMLISQARLRYAPTLGLALPQGRSHKPRPNVGVALGKLYPQDDETVASEAFERFATAVPGAVALPRDLAAPAHVYRTMLDGLIVLDDLGPSSSPYGWTPLPGDRNQAASPLASWMSLPWGGPQHVILPGYHTSAESGLRKGPTTGDEVFLTVCGLMASGARTVLLSRWRTAGQTSTDLMREFAQELPHISPAEAWQRSVRVVGNETLDPDLEPRVKLNSQFETKASHPFFWSGYMLVDSGQSPGDADDAAAADSPDVQPGKAKPAGPIPAGPKAAGPKPAGPVPAGPLPPGARRGGKITGPRPAAGDTPRANPAPSDAGDSKAPPIRNKPRAKSAPKKKSSPRATDA